MFARSLLEDRVRNASKEQALDRFGEEWANNSVEDFLEAAASWVENSDFGARPNPKPENPWQFFASFLWAGRCYE